MHRTRALLTLLIAAPAFEVAAQAPAPLKLSFADAVSHATGNAPAVTIAGLRTEEAGARERVARAPLLPTFAIGGTYLNRSFNSRSIGITFPGIPELIGPFNNYDGRLTATQTVLDLSSMARVRAAKAAVTGSTADERAVVENAALTTALVYLRGTRSLALVSARRADSSIAAELVHLAEEQRKAGVSAAIDVTRARTQLVVAEGQLILAADASDRDRIDLARTLGLDPATPIQLTDTLSSALAVVPRPENRDSAIARALEDRPDLAAEHARGDAARQDSSAISAERLPRLAVEGDYGVNGPTVPSAIMTRQLAVSLNIPLLDGFGREGRKAEQDALARESDVREHDLRQQIAADIDVAVIEINAAEAQQQIAAERLRLAEDELSQSRERFAAGVAGNIEVINAQSSLILARDADIESRFGAANARVALARALGMARTLH